MPHHPSVQHVLQFFTYAHLPNHLRGISKMCAAMAYDMARDLPQSPELTTGLRKLLEAKDCFVRAALVNNDVGRDGSVSDP